MTPTEYENFKNWIKEDQVKMITIKPNAAGTKYDLTLITPKVKIDGTIDQWTFQIKMEAQ